MFNILAPAIVTAPTSKLPPTSFAEVIKLPPVILPVAIT